MMEYVEHGYTVSSRPQITATGPRIYTELKETQVTELCSQNISFTVDIWSSRATQGYITLTLHWVGGEWQLQNKVSFTAKNIANHLAQGFANINVTVVHNNASIMTTAINSMSWESLPCVTHTLQLVVKKVLEVSKQD